MFSAYVISIGLIAMFLYECRQHRPLLTNQAESFFGNLIRYLRNISSFMIHDALLRLKQKCATGALL
jgi:hypothetical protein